MGESLLPAVVPLLRKLGIEEQVKSFSQRKPGVAFVARGGQRMDFFFPGKETGGLPNYAYNVPREAFDHLLRQRAAELGAKFVSRRATLETSQGEREVQLAAGMLESVPELHGTHPRLLVDATGRTRTFAKTLHIGAVRGTRNDVAYFAHYDGFLIPSSREGQVVINGLSRGWCWRIPLPGRLSVGVVLDAAAARRHGATPADRLESILASEPSLQADSLARRRLSEVMTYTNYQLVSERGHGPGWVAAGDAFGFVDPTLSPGLFMAMLSADLLDRMAFAAGPSVLDDPRRLSRQFARVFHELRDWHLGWQKIIEYFYDGRMHSLYEAGAGLSEKYGNLALPVMLERHLAARISGMVSGSQTRSRYARGLVGLASRHLTRGATAPAAFSVLSGV